MLHRARAAGIDVVVVSASPIDIVVAAASRAGLADSHIIAARPRFDGEHMVAEVERPIPYGSGKVTRLRQWFGEKQMPQCSNDSACNIPMLASARVPVAVRPKPRLREHFHEIPGVVELAPLPT